jgi:hypothetical protein
MLEDRLTEQAVLLLEQSAILQQWLHSTVAVGTYGNITTMTTSYCCCWDIGNIATMTKFHCCCWNIVQHCNNDYILLLLLEHSATLQQWLHSTVAVGIVQHCNNDYILLLLLGHRQYCNNDYISLLLLVHSATLQQWLHPTVAVGTYGNIPTMTTFHCCCWDSEIFQQWLHSTVVYCCQILHVYSLLASLQHNDAQRTNKPINGLTHLPLD